MNKFLESAGLRYLWGKFKSYVTWENIAGKPDLALKSDIANVYRYKGSVADYASLPAEGNAAGDVWNLMDTGMNYAWTGTEWDALGESFQIESITNAEIDAIMAEA